MNPEVLKILHELKQSLENTSPNPWSNVEAWRTKTTPSIQEFWPNHYSAFVEATKPPRWIQLPRAGGIGEPYDNPFNRSMDASERAGNKNLAEEKKTQILEFLSGLLRIGAILQNFSENQSALTIAPRERLTHFEQQTGGKCNVLGDVKWSKIEEFLLNIPTPLEQADFLSALAGLPDEGVSGGIIHNPQAHNRNQAEVLAPLHKKRWSLISQHFDLPKILQRASAIKDHAEALEYLWNIRSDYERYHPTIRQNVFQPEELSFVNAIKSEIERRKDLRDSLATERPNFTIMGDQYYNSGQAAAMGPDAQVHGNTFQQIQAQQGNLNLDELADELSKLRREMKREAAESEDPQHDMAVSEIAQAEQAAKAGDGEKTVGHLKAVGKWALEVATKIGVSIAAEVIERASGMKP